MTDDPTPRCLWPGPCQLGEGVVWSEAEQAVWFVDILGQELHRHEVRTGRHDSWATPGRPGFVALGIADGPIIGLPKGLYRFDVRTKLFEHLVGVELDRGENRLNDGAVGPDGALWFGSKNELEDAPSGAWYRWSGAGAPERFDDGYVVTNGPAFSLDGRILYHSDSVAGRILSRSVGCDGDVGVNRLFVEIEDGAGYPDGLAVDCDDCVWVALWGGGALRRYSPEGRFLSEVRLPCDQVTRPCFGGRERRTLFVTTARVGLTVQELARQPLAGALFALGAPAPGPQLPAFAPSPAAVGVDWLESPR